MTLKSDAKFVEKLTLGSKNDMRNLVNFNASSSTSGNLHFEDPNFEEKLTFHLKNNMNNFGEL